MVYSKYELAIEKAREHVEKEERDLFLCMVRYPSGIEFVLKPNLPIGFNFLECFKLPFHHHFKTEKSANRAAKCFSQEMGININVIPETYTEQGYVLISHYRLCST